MYSTFSVFSVQPGAGHLRVFTSRPQARAGDSVGPGLGATFRLMTPNDISLCTVYIE